MAQSNQIIEIFKARGNLLKQLSRQGFNVEDYEGSNINEVNLMFLEKQMDMLVTNPKTSQKTYVKYHLEKGKSKSLRVANIQDFIEDLFENASEVILDGVIAQSGQQSKELWSLREAIPLANRAIGAICSFDISTIE